MAGMPTRLASIEPHADRWYAASVGQAKHQANGLYIPLTAAGDLPDPSALRAYLLDTLESTLDLLAKTPDQADALYFFRLALMHEDLRGEQLVELAQTHGLALPLDLPNGHPPREPLVLPAQRWMLGTAPDTSVLGHFTFDREKWAHEVCVPEFEIDAHPVTWAQFVEFVGDGGYDRADLWHPEGWAWVTQHQRRAPRCVEQIGVARFGGSGAVVQTVFGKTTRMAGNQAALHISWWEADAWCRWAGRRLPSEVEWELAAHQAARRGFQSGVQGSGVHEWTAGSLHRFPGFAPDAWASAIPRESPSESGQVRVLRGASFATRARLRDGKFRGFAPRGFDVGFVGFRSCAV